MDKELANTLVTFLAPALSLAGLILVLVPFISPAAAMTNRPPLVVVEPSSSTKYPSNDLDGSSIFFGLLSRSIGLQVFGGAHSAF